MDVEAPGGGSRNV